MVLECLNLLKLKKNILIEIKCDEKAKFTKQQIKFNDNWRGQRVRVHDEYEAFEAIGANVNSYQGI